MPYEWRGPRYADADGYKIICEILLGEEWCPFVASPSDVEPRGVATHAAITAAGGIAPYEPPPSE
jgi:hypothetical protein